MRLANTTTVFMSDKVVVLFVENPKTRKDIDGVYIVAPTKGRRVRFKGETSHHDAARAASDYDYEAAIAIHDFSQR